ncbi:MAG TPA: SIMPL domain-containing protein [Solirubrobacteraceae bacterium]
MNHRLRPLTLRLALAPIAAAAIAGLGASSALGAPTIAPSAASVVSIPATAAPIPPAPAPAPAAAAPASTLTITGEGTVEIAPDVATLSIEVRSTAATASGARSKANARTNAVLLAITKLGIDRGSIQTSGISLSRSQVAATRHHPAHKLYAAANDLTVRTTEVSLVGPLVDAATRAGADSIDGPDFSFGDPSAGKAAATRAALADARSRADDAAAAIGYAVVGVQSIAIDPDESQTPVALGAAAPAAAEVKAPTPAPVDPGQQEVDATVDVVFLIAPAP